MKKVFPQKPPAKRLSRKVIDLLSSLVLIITITALFFVTNMTHIEDNESVSTGNFAIYKGSEDKPIAAMMFNVYEGSDIVMEILSILRKYSIKSTFFIGGIWAENNIETLRAIKESGQEIGCHGYLHKDHSKLSLEQNKEEIAKCNRLIYDTIGYTVTLFAPPSGAFGENTEKACRALGQKMILWTKDTIDWRDSDPSLLVKRATKNISNGDLILMHPKAQTVTALPTIIEAYLAQNISLGTVSEVIA